MDVLRHLMPCRSMGLRHSGHHGTKQPPVSSSPEFPGEIFRIWRVSRVRINFRQAREVPRVCQVGCTVTEVVFERVLCA